MPKNANQILRHAKMSAKRGAFEEARQYYHEVLQQYPENKRAKDGLKNLPAALFGVTAQLDENIKALLALHAEERFEEAFSQGTRLLEENTHVPVIHNILGVLNTTLGRPEEAVQNFKKAIEINSSYMSAYVSLGNVLCSIDRNDEAIDSFKKGLAFEPSNLEALNGLASIYRACGRHTKALSIFSKMVKLKPGSASAYANLGNTYYDLKRYTESSENFQKALNIDSTLAAVSYSLANAFSALGEHSKAIESLNDAVKSNPDFAGAYVNRGVAQQRIGMTEEAVASFNKAIDVQPAMSAAHNNLANIHRAVGNIEDAIASYRRAIDCEPCRAEYYRSLSLLVRYEPNDPQIQVMETMYFREALSEHDKMNFAFALGKAHDDIGNIDTAFSYYTEANRLRQKAIGYDLADDKRDFSVIKSLFNGMAENPAETEPCDDDQVIPVFVVGMPRSGTSLVEQILSSHSKVHGAGELNILPGVVGPMIGKKIEKPGFQITQERRVEIRVSYLQGLEKIGAKEKFIVDKLPLNFQYLGFVALAFPGAKIINLNRDPLATCWSIFKSYFPTKGNGYAYDLVDLAAYYKLYQDMMTHWREKFSGRIYDLNYEALTENQESETRKLLGFCGLDWQAACLDFHQTKRRVLTASDAQVRQKMYTGSSAAWLKYEDHLGPLIAGLQE